MCVRECHKNKIVSSQLLSFRENVFSTNPFRVSVTPWIVFQDETKTKISRESLAESEKKVIPNTETQENCSSSISIPNTTPFSSPINPISSSNKKGYKADSWFPTLLLLIPPFLTPSLRAIAANTTVLRPP